MMTSYLLLRSNKESGPYNLEDLVKMGLKPYDLVWIKGKSAAWRYPSEIEELKSYAQAIEEQPYDRFYKKDSVNSQQSTVNSQQSTVNSQQSAPVTSSHSTVESIPQLTVSSQQPIAIGSAAGNQQPLVKEIKQEPIAVPAPAAKDNSVIEEQYKKYIPQDNTPNYTPKKSVFVTMPGQKTAAVQKPVVTEPKVSNPVPVPAPVPEPAPQATITVTENPEAAKIKYSQPLDEIKEMYVKTLQERKSKIARKGFLLANLKKAAVILGLIALGVLAGFVIKTKSGNNPATLARQTIGPVDQAAVTNPNNNETVEEKSSQQQIDPQNIPSTVPDQSTSENLTIEEVIPKTELSPAIKEQLLRQDQRADLKDKTKKPDAVIEPAEIDLLEERTSNIEKNPSTGERSRRVRNEKAETAYEPAEQKAVMRSRKNHPLSNLVSVTSNDYKRVAFGGIRNLELTVTNDSKYTLDKVTVELQYLKPSEEPLKTEMIQFYSVSPNGSLTMKVRDTNRGIKVLYKIVDIQPQQKETASSGF